MPLIVNVPAVVGQPPPLSVQPPPLTVADAQMVAALQADGYTVSAPGSTPPPPPPTGTPAAPTGLTVKINGTSLQLAWANPTAANPVLGGNDIYVDNAKQAWPGYPNPVVSTYTLTLTPGNHLIEVTAYNGVGESPRAGITVTIVAPVTPPPATGTKPAWGEYHPGNYATTPAIILDYCDNANTYQWTSARAAFLQGRRLLLKGGNFGAANATAVGTTLVANGQANAIIGIDTEGNQDVAGWYNAWNERSETAAQFIANFLADCAAFRAVPGAKFTFAWCPNVNNAGNQASGRNQFDTFPGTGVNGDIVVAPDGYDNPGDTGSLVASNMAYTVLYEQFAASKGAQFAGLCECGDNASDDPTYWVGPNGVLTHGEANGWLWVINFQATTSQGGAFDSTTGPNARAAIDGFYA